MNSDELRNAALLLGADRARVLSDVDGRGCPALLTAARRRRIPRRAVRLAHAVLAKAGRLSYESGSLAPATAARRAVLGDAAEDAPRFLIRVDEFPHARAADLPDRYGAGAFARFHEVMLAAGVPYLVAALPRLSVDYLDPEETAWVRMDERSAGMLRRVQDEGVSVGLHGLTHRTVSADPRRHSELCGLSEGELSEMLDTGLGVLGEIGVVPRAFVAPFNRFDPGQYAQLARRFPVITGGPESVRLMGWHPTPTWLGDAVYMPCYPPLYGRARDLLAVVRDLVGRRVGGWVPLVLHWGWEMDAGLTDLRALCDELAGVAASWDAFLAEVLAAEGGPR